MLALAIGPQRFEPIARRHTQIGQDPGLIQKAKFLSTTFWMSAGSFRLRRPDQINSPSGSAKPCIMVDYNAMRYSLQPAK